MLGALSAKDIVAIAGYFIVIIAVGFFFSWKKKTPSDYFFAGRKLGWISIGTSLLSAGISSEHLLGLAAAGSTSGLAVGGIELVASIMLLVLGWKLAPIYLRSQVNTMPEFLERRYGSSSRWLVSSVSIMLYTLTRFSISLYVGTALLKFLLGWDTVTSAMIVVLAAGVYTLIGGLKTVVYTNLLQAGVLIVVSLALTRIGLREAGADFRHFFSTTPPETWSLFKSIDHPDFPWTGVLLGAPILAFWYLGADQYMMQRILGAKDLNNARRGAVFAALLKIPVMFALVLPGMIALKLSGGNVAGDKAYAWMVTTFLPSGIRGMVIAGLFAALMSSLSNTFHTTSTLLTFDFIKRLRPKVDEKTLVRSGRLATALMVGLGLLWIPVIGWHGEGRMFMLLLSIQACVAPPIAAVFLLGITWQRANSKGAMASLVTGLVIGGLRLIVDITTTAHPISNPILSYVASVNFLHFAFFLFVASAAVLVAVSLATEPPDRARIQRTVVLLQHEKGTPRSIDKLASLGLIAVVIALCLFFR